MEVLLRCRPSGVELDGDQVRIRVLDATTGDEVASMLTSIPVTGG
jgi:hypothetical protein